MAHVVAVLISSLNLLMCDRLWRGYSDGMPKQHFPRYARHPSIAALHDQYSLQELGSRRTFRHLEQISRGA
jgi:hypothetical protein